MTRAFQLVGLGLLGMLIASAAWGWYTVHPNLWPEYRQATALVTAVEQFKSDHGRLPASISELKSEVAPETDQIFYRPTGSDSYEVWFGLRLGESYTYDSSSRAWQ